MDLTVFPWRRATEPAEPVAGGDDDLAALFVHAERFCPRCNDVTTWLDYEQPGSGMLACARLRPDEQGPCGMTSTATLTDRECVNRDRWLAKGGSGRRSYSWV